MFIVYITEISEDTNGGNISGNLLIYLPKKEDFEENVIKIMKQSTPSLFIFLIILCNSNNLK